MKYTLPNLPYSYKDLEPHIDEQTMTIHHTKHHQAYINNLNTALEGKPDLENLSLEELLANLDAIPEVIRTAVRNNGGGHYNHSMFWETLTPKPIQPSIEFNKLIESSFGGLEILKDEFTKAAMSRFGSGWAWLIHNDGELKIVSTPNQDNPLMEGHKPILGLDIWEHAYYLNYQNRRADYISNWWHLVNWIRVEENLNI